MKSVATFISFLVFFVNVNAQVSWFSQTSGVTSPLTDIFFIDNETGWISGWTGTMLHTTDAGATWALQDIPPSNAYYSVYFTDAMNGWASGYSGLVVHTTDGGVTWEIQETPTSYELLSIYFTDSNHGWIAGGYYGSFPSYDESRIILYTNDGGANWAIQHIQSYKSPLRSIVFADDTTGYATGEDGILMSTSNGGLDWNESTINSFFEFYDIDFINRDTGWVAGEYLGLPHYGALYKTMDGGVTWEEQSVGEGQFAVGVSFIDGMNGWAVGQNFDNEPSIFYTTDGGENWDSQAAPPGSEALGHVLFMDENTGWAVGNIGTIITTVNTTVGITENSINLQPVTPEFSLEQNYPNPFSDITRINIQLPGESTIDLEIYNILGQKVATLANGAIPAGSYSYTWNGNSDDGRTSAPGIYILRLQSGDQVQSRRMNLVR